MSDVQAGILAAVPPQARYLCFSTLPAAPTRSTHCARCANWPTAGESWSASASRWCGRWAVSVAGLRSFAGAVGPGLELPATPAALWCWLRGEDRGELVHPARAVEGTRGRCAFASSR